MAINYLAKIGESSDGGNPEVVTIGSAVSAESLVVVALAGRRSGSAPGITSVTDSKGNTYAKYSLVNSDKVAGICYARLSVGLDTSDTITVTWNGAFTDSWASVHSFENASGTRHHQAFTAASDATPQVTVNVTGSDWLTFGVFYYSTVSTTTITPVNSSLSRDSQTDYFAECFSRNGTTGSTHTIGGTTSTSQAHTGVAVSFPYLVGGGAAGSGGNARYQPTVIGV